MAASIASVQDALERVTLEDFRPESQRQAEKKPRKPFRFLDLPSEIRIRIYSFVLFSPRPRKTVRSSGSVGASSKNKPLAPITDRIALFLVSRQLHDEATHVFYSSQTFRLFPIQDYSRLPTVRALPPRYRPSITTIELILGSSWTAPPKSWRVNDSLGLESMVCARTLKVFIQCDPSHPVFEGFRVSKDYYTDFAGDLLKQILARLPNLVQVEFDGYPSVLKRGTLMTRLFGETRAARKKIYWGPERGWYGLPEEHNDEVSENEELEVPYEGKENGYASQTAAVVA